MHIDAAIPLAEYVKRRAAVMRALGREVGVVFAGEAAPGDHSGDRSFLYLTGILDEPGAAVLFDPGAEMPRHRTILFLKPRNPEMETWDGYRDELSAELRHRTGFSAIMRTTMLPRMLTQAARRSKSLACLHALSTYEAQPSPDLSTFRKLAERIPGVQVVDRSMLLPGLRAVKSKAELAQMRLAAEATGAGYAAAMRALRPGLGERELQRAIETAFVDAGASGPAYSSIVGSGISGTVLHYIANRGECGAGEVVCIDAGARVGGYCADVTRSLPVDGVFTREQREVYRVVLRALDAGIAAVRPGAWMHQVDEAARSVIDKAGFGDTFVHGIGHQLGLDVHDATPDGPLRAGMVVTVEPGVYLKDRALGIRIEDDVLVTPKGRQNLTASIPRTIEQIERAMARKR